MLGLGDVGEDVLHLLLLPVLLLHHGPPDVLGISFGENVEGEVVVTRLRDRHWEVHLGLVLLEVDPDGHLLKVELRLHLLERLSAQQQRHVTLLHNIHRDEDLVEAAGVVHDVDGQLTNSERDGADSSSELERSVGLVVLQHIPDLGRV